ncbi:uncharacterized protein LOC119072743 isoform X2 [Bradysia coprophila]|uniref:uncharacterized protein LOC119072743 isoform X2 n=1 Tax=Bradysia coprophila TaxID=38358 RepID=UPI00187DCAF5|nr:uncharacterized protein LOC119072743 isoform X2 [Bradysia coprophila]
MCSPEDDFFYVLDKSLRNEYSSQKLSSFITDLLAAINNLDDDPDEEFGFYDDETDCWNGFDSFTAPSSNDYSETHQIDFRTGNIKKRVDMLDDEPSQDPVSNRGANSTVVDLFDNEHMCKTETRSHEMNIEYDEGEEAPPPQSVPVADIALILEDESRDSSIDMFAEFETDVEVMDTSVGLDDTNTTKQIADCQNKDAEDAQCVRQVNRCNNEQHGVESLTTQSETIVSHSSALRKSFTLPHDLQDEQHSPMNEHMGTEVKTTQKLLSQPNIESSDGAEDKNVENEAGHSVDILLGVPINISYYEGNEGENTEMQISQMTSHMVHRTLSVATNFPEIFSAKENLPQHDDRGTLHSVDERPDTSMRTSCQSSPLRGFSPVAPLLQQSSYASTKLDSDSNTTPCEEYEFSNNFVPRSPRSSPIFLGFSDEAALTHTSQHHNSMAAAISQTSEHHNFIHTSSRSEGGLNSTFCEEYESERLFAAYLNATQGDQINLEEAYTQCFSESQNPVSGTRDRRQSFIEEIEKLVLKIGNDLTNGRKLAIAVPYRVSWNNCFVNEERLILRPLGNGGTRTIASKRRIAMIVSVLSFVYKLLVNNETCTRREIYYSDPEFTHSQIQVDTAIMDICFILNAPPWAIGILSSSKGLIAGSIKLTLKDDTVLDVGSVDGGILLPQQTMSIKKVETAARFVLLVEKHTVYEKLLLENVLDRLGPCILITGKGYPDINTRVILKKIWDDCKCPIYALVDADPYGIEIMLTYRHGSQKMSLFNDNLAIPSIQWIGVFPSEIKKFNLLSLPLTPQDINRLDSLMKRPYLSTKIYEELLVLKRTQKKSEVEALLSSTVVDCMHSHLLHKIHIGGLI